MPLILIYIFIVLASQTKGEFRDTTYLQTSIDGSTIPSRPLFDRRGLSVTQCGSLCMLNQCCKEILYDSISGRCVEMHFKDFVIASDNSVYHSTFEGMRIYTKECEKGWTEFKGHCYIKRESKMKWMDAQLECETMCSYLIEIESKEESDWLAGTYLDNANCVSDPFSGCTAWTGLNDLDIEGQYRWNQSNKLLSFSNWHFHEPSLVDPTQAYSRDCVDILRDGVWNDRPCSYLNSVICEKSFKD